LALTANTGKPLSAWEVGTAYVRLVRFGWTPEKIAERMGQSVNFVNRAIELADAPDAVKQLLSTQAITPSLAIAELRRSGDSAAEVLQAKVQKTKAQGGAVAKRDRAKNHVSLKTLVSELLDTIVAKDMADDRDTVRVPKTLIRKLQKAV
jgi:hypothetical protein